MRSMSVAGTRVSRKETRSHRSGADACLAAECPAEFSSIPYAQRRFIVVADDAVAHADALMRQAAAKFSGDAARFSHANADEKADAIIAQMTRGVALAALFPAHFNWLIMTGIEVRGVLKMAGVYGQRMEKDDAKKLAKKLAGICGVWYGMARGLGKLFSIAVESTGVGYAGGVALDSAISASGTYVFGHVAKGFLKGEPEHVLKSIAGTKRKEARRESQGIAKAGARNQAPDYAALARILASPAGCDVADHALSCSRDLSDLISGYMSKNDVPALSDLTAEDLETIDRESGAAVELWSLMGEAVEIPRLLAVVNADPGAIENLRTIRANGCDVAPVNAATASALKFPTGHPRRHTLYAAHPTGELTYYPFAGFHRFAFEHKYFEACRLLASLGASKIEVAVEKGWSAEYAAKAGFSWQAVPVAAGGGSTRGARYAVAFTGHYAPSAAPAIPRDLVWYPHEPNWQIIADGRLHHNLRQFSLELRYEDDFGVHAGLHGRLAVLPAGLDLGGSFARHEATVWRLSGEFPSFRSKKDLVLKRDRKE